MPITPYTATELAEFKAILDAKLAEAEQDLQLLMAALDHEPTKKPEAIIGDTRFIQPDQVVTRDECDQLRKRQEKFIQHLKDAQLRIANRTYGICRVTGKPISKERLRLVPHATLSIEAKATTVPTAGHPGEGRDLDQGSGAPDRSAPQSEANPTV